MIRLVIANDVCVAGLISADAMLTIHSCKAHLVSTLTLSTTCLADAIIQLAVAKGQRHEVRPTCLLVNL